MGRHTAGIPIEGKKFLASLNVYRRFKATVKLKYRSFGFDFIQRLYIMVINTSELLFLRGIVQFIPVLVVKLNLKGVGNISDAYVTGGADQWQGA